MYILLHSSCQGVDFDAAEDDGYKFITFYGLEDYHVSIPLSKETLFP